jgi:hypothetical protein
VLYGVTVISFHIRQNEMTKDIDKYYTTYSVFWFYYVTKYRFVLFTAYFTHRAALLNIIKHRVILLPVTITHIENYCARH